MIGVSLAGWIHAGVMGGEMRRFQHIASTLGVGVPLTGMLCLFPAAVGATIASPRVPSDVQLAALLPVSVLTNIKTIVAIGAGTLLKNQACCY